jgi:hypothetical protein
MLIDQQAEKIQKKNDQLLIEVRDLQEQNNYLRD